MTDSTTRGLTQALNFTSDLQEGHGQTQKSFLKLLAKWEGKIVNDSTLAFSDNSTAQYNSDEHNWIVVEDVCRKCFGSGSIPVGGKSDRSVICRNCDSYEKNYGKSAA